MIMTLNLILAATWTLSSGSFLRAHMERSGWSKTEKVSATVALAVLNGAVCGLTAYLTKLASS